MSRVSRVLWCAMSIVVGNLSLLQALPISAYAPRYDATRSYVAQDYGQHKRFRTRNRYATPVFHRYWPWSKKWHEARNWQRPQVVAAAQPSVATDVAPQQVRSSASVALMPQPEHRGIGALLLALFIMITLFAIFIVAFRRREHFEQGIVTLEEGEEI